MLVLPAALVWAEEPAPRCREVAAPAPRTPARHRRLTRDGTRTSGPEDREPTARAASSGAQPAAAPLLALRRHRRSSSIAIIAVRLNTLSTRRRGRPRSAPEARHAAAAVRRPRRARRRSTATRTSPRTTARRSRIPCPDDERRTPACEIEPEGAIRVCDLFDRPLVISFWFTRGGDCLPSQDVVDDVSRRYGDRVNFLSVNVARRPRGGAADRRRARLAAAGRPTTPTAPSPTSTGSASARR